MRGGALRKRVTIQTPAVVNGIQKWVTFGQGPVWAAVVPVTGHEIAGALTPTTIAMENVTIRYQAGIKAKMRLVLATRVLEISSVINVEERNRELDLICHEVSA